MVVLVFISIVVVSITSLILYARWNYGVLEKMGIPVVKPHFILGSTYNVHNEVVPVEDMARLRKYGSVFGVYEGRTPQVHICDPVILKAIMAQDFEHFNGRRRIDFGSPLFNEIPDFIPEVEKWKFVRQITSATVSPGKLKGMSGAMKECIEEFTRGLMEDVNRNGGKPLLIPDFKKSIFLLLPDLIARAVYCVKVESSDGVENEFVRISKVLVGSYPPKEESHKPNILLPISLSFPFLRPLLLPTLINTKAGDDFVKIFKTVLETRRKSGREQKDYTETVLGWIDKLESAEFKKLNVTELTVIMQALVMFFAGLDQISLILLYMLLEISKSPDIEKKLLSEIDAFLKRHGGVIEYEELSELTYMSACINESSRLVSFFIRAERICTKDWEMNGLKIKKGMHIMIPLWAVNTHPDYFPDPDKYDPERFMPPNKDNIHPYAFIPFGQGPRSCVGYKLALGTMALLTIHIYKDFRFQSYSHSKLSIVPGSLFQAFVDPIPLDIIKRVK